MALTLVRAKGITPKRRSAAEIIATHLGWDMADVTDTRYQPTVYVQPALFTIGDYYYCAPAKKRQRLPKGWKWKYMETVFGREVYRAHMSGSYSE